jgi:hypothetical protein
MLPMTGSKLIATTTSSAASCQSSTFKARSAQKMKTSSEAFRTRIAPTVMMWLSTEINGCSSQASGGGITYCGPVGSRQPIVRQRSYGSLFAASLRAARM